MSEWLPEILRQGGFAACAGLLLWAYIRKERECAALRAEVTMLVSEHGIRVDKINDARISEAMRSVEALAVSREFVEVVREMQEPPPADKRGRR